MLLVLPLLAAGCGRREEISFRFCLRQLPAGYYPAECNEPDLETHLALMKSTALWREVAPRIGGRISDPERFRASLQFERQRVVHTVEATQWPIVVSGRGEKDDDIAPALELLVEAMQRYLAAHQPELASMNDRSGTHVPYAAVTGGPEKLYRYIER